MLISGFFDGLYIGQDENGAIYDRMYQAEFFSKYFSSFISNGIFNKNPNSFKLFVIDNNTIGVNKGSCFINGYFGFSNDITTLPITPNNNGNNRIDRVVLRLDLSLRDITIELLQGEPNADPTPNDFVRYGDIYDLVIGDILINNNGTITNEDITDKRDNNLLCGYVNHNFNMIDNTSMYYNVLKFIRHSKIEEKKEFDKWFNNIKNVLNSNTVSKHIINTPFATDGVHGFKYNINKNTFEKFENGEYKEIKISKKITLDKTPRIFITSTDKEIKINWDDAKDIIINNNIINKWIGTILVKKAGSPPLSYYDGEILIDNKVRDNYKNTPYIDTNVNEDIEYYYGIFPYDQNGDYNTNINNIVNAHLNLLSKKTYSFIIDLDDSNPDTNITYTDDAEEYTNPESWDNSPLFKSIRPCVLKDGIVNYYLDPNNYDLKEDGTQSNLTGIDGDVMVEFPPLVYKMEKIEDNKCKFYITLDKDNLSSEDWCKIHLDYNNGVNISKKLYHSVYINDSQNDLITSRASYLKPLDIIKLDLNRIKRNLKNKNNTSFIIHHCMFKLLILLCYLRFKTTKLQKVFNLERQNTYTIGSLKTGGLFSGCGSDTPQEAVKICGIEFFYSSNLKIILGGIGAYSNTSAESGSSYGNSEQLYLYTFNNVFNDNPNLNLSDLYKRASNEDKNLLFEVILSSKGTVIEEISGLGFKTYNQYMGVSKDFLNLGKFGFLPISNEGFSVSTDTYLTIENWVVKYTWTYNSTSNYESKMLIWFSSGGFFYYLKGDFDNTSNAYLFYYMYLPPNED